MIQAILKAILVVTALVVASVALGFLITLFASRWEVGPGCPGDPEWLGFCSEVDAQ